MGTGVVCFQLWKNVHNIKGEHSELLLSTYCMSPTVLGINEREHQHKYPVMKSVSDLEGAEPGPGRSCSFPLSHLCACLPSTHSLPGTRPDTRRPGAKESPTDLRPCVHEIPPLVLCLPAGCICFAKYQSHLCQLNLHNACRKQAQQRLPVPFYELQSPWHCTVKTLPKVMVWEGSGLPIFPKST